MLEVAVFADILTLKEALEFDRNIQSEDQFQLTSCCCPMWIAMIKKALSPVAAERSRLGIADDCWRPHGKGPSS